MSEAGGMGEVMSIDPRLVRLRVELYTAAQTLKGESRDCFVELVREINVVLDAELEGRPSTIPPVNRDATTTTDGRSVNEVRAEQRGEAGMHKSYLVLSDEERKRGFVRTVRDSYVHEKCGSLTRMSRQIAETYARDPGFYGSTFCVACCDHFPVGEHGEFTWADGDKSKVGT